jgi:hypothetical protein
MWMVAATAAINDTCKHFTIHLLSKMTELMGANVILIRWKARAQCLRSIRTDQQFPLWQKSEEVEIARRSNVAFLMEEVKQSEPWLQQITSIADVNLDDPLYMR